MNNNNSRRSFIKNTALTAASFYIVPRHVLGRGFVAPSDKLNIAGIGAGGKAEVNLTFPMHGTMVQRTLLHCVMWMTGWL
jgi:hypothetical protein